MTDLAPDPDAPSAPAPAAVVGAVDEDEGLKPGKGGKAGPSAGGGGGVEGGDDEDSGDEAAPDYRLIASLARKGASSGGGANAPMSIPKRGEKDFEPTGFVAQSRALEASRSAMFDVISTERKTGSKSISVATWEPLLKRAIVHTARGTVLNAMGVSHRVFVLEDGRDEDLAQLTSGDGETSKRAGVTKQDIFYPKTRVRLELFPEEALYLVERGALECRIRIDGKTADVVQEQSNGDDDETDSKDTQWIPMTVQQAFATMLDTDGNTRQRYQLYAYLKRLGYFVQRVQIVDELRKVAADARRKKRDAQEQDGEEEEELAAKGILIDKKHPLRLVTIFDLVLYPLRRTFQASYHGVQSISAWLLALLQWLRSRVSGALMASKGSNNLGQKKAQAPGRGLLGITGGRWDSYDAVFDRLRFVPSGHDRPFHGDRPTKEAEGLKLEAPEICLYAWRPATHYKRTDPPLPEFRIAVMDAQKTSLLSGRGFGELYAQLPPVPSQNRGTGHEGEEEGEDEEEDEEEKKRAAMQKKRNDESYGRGAVKKMAAAAEAKRKKAIAERSTAAPASAAEPAKNARVDPGILAAALEAPRVRLFRLLRLLTAIFSLLPPGARPVVSSYRRPGYGAGRRPGGGPRTPNVFPPLKAGRRNVIVAVNDCGTTSLLRFGESEFHRWKLAGSTTTS